MSLFKQVEGEAAVIVKGGVYYQVPVFTRNGYLFAKHGAGFIKLMVDGSTTVAKCYLDTLTWDGKLGTDKLGRLVDASEVRDAQALDNRRLLKLGLKA